MVARRLIRVRAMLKGRAIPMPPRPFLLPKRRPRGPTSTVNLAPRMRALKRPRTSQSRPGGLLVLQLSSVLLARRPRLQTYGSGSTAVGRALSRKIR